MKRLSVFALVVTLLMCGHVYGADRETVFRDLAWGDPVSALGGATKAQEDSGLSIYIKDDEVKSLGSLPVTLITYMFFEDRLIGVGVQSKEPDRMKEVLIAKYGTPNNDNEFDDDIADEVTWFLGDTVVRFTSNAILDEGMFVMAHRPGYMEWQAYKDDQAQKDAASW